MGATKKRFHFTTAVVSRDHAIDLRCGIHDHRGFTLGYVYHECFAESLTRALNNHDALVEACEAFLEAWDKSHQLEKTDQALTLARAALEGVRKGE